MSKYIEVDALIKALRLEYPMMPMFKENRKEWEVKTEGYRNAEKIISNAPTIDIVHCRECKYAEIADKTDDQDGYTCQFHRGSIWFSGSFCSWGKRKESE